MSVSKVNIVCSGFSYAPKITSNPENVKNLLKGLLITGLDKFLIESLTIVNKIARVVTSEKDFRSVAGAKLEIGGSGNVEIDAIHELTVIYSDGFSFELDVPDAAYTNGLTYNIPSLGWSLMDQDSKRLLLKPGRSSTTNSRILLTDFKDQTSSWGDRDAIRVNVVFNIDKLVDIKYNGFLNTLNKLPIIKHIGYVNEGNYVYWFYGDDAFFLFKW